MTRSRPSHSLVRLALVALLALPALGGCASLLRRTPPPLYGFQRLRYETTRVLNVEEQNPAYYRARARLEVMGPELDDVLIALITDNSASETVRVNAATLLADRRGFDATGVLRRVLVYSPSDALRAAAVAGLQRFVADSPQVHDALRAALTDPYSRVRLGALQGLDVEDAPYVRALLPGEDDSQVRVVAQQLLTLFEARGAALAPNERGDLRTTGGDTVPRIVFHPVQVDTVGQVASGALWVELPRGRGLVPLAQEVMVVGGVVPAFFDAQRRSVVYEADGRIYVRDLASAQTRTVGLGIAPRLVPFSDRFVFVREVPGSRRRVGSNTELDYEVVRAAFADAAPVESGRLHATIRPERHHSASPVRTMVVGEASDGFVLRGTDVTSLVLPGPYEGRAAPSRP